MRSIVTNSARDIRRGSLRCRGEVRLGEARTTATAGASPEDRVAEEGLLRVRRETVTLLREPYRAAVELRFERELSTPVAAKRLGITRSNASSRLHRVLHLLKKRFRARLRRRARPRPLSRQFRH